MRRDGAVHVASALRRALNALRALRALRALALLVALGGVVRAGPLADQLSPGHNESIDLEGMMALAMWPGPQRGCASVGGHGELRLECALPAGRLTLATDRASYLSITCEPEEDGRPGSFSCSELEREVGSELRAGGATPAGAVLRSLALERCALPPSLACAPALLGARDAAALTLRAVPAALTPALLAPFASLAHLRILDAGENLTSVPYETLTALPALRRLTITGGALSLAEGWRPPLPRLAALELSAGGLRALPPRAFDGLPALRNLSLWGNKIENVTDDSFQGLPELERLILNSNSLTSLPAGLLLPTPRLKLLHLYGNELRALPRALLQPLKDLEEVWLNNKNSSELQLDDDAFADLPALHTLKIESCGLRAVGERLVRGSRALRALSLRGNLLGELPAALLGEQVALRSLDLARNRLAALPASLLGATSALHRLDLSRNVLATLPRGAFRSLAVLTELDLSRNQIEELHLTMFEGLKSIEELSLSYNKLRMDADALSVDAQRRSPLAELRTLRRLDLRNNSLRLFMDDWRDLVYLETLDLSYNAITELTDVDFELLGEAEVDVRHNDIRVIRYDDTRRVSDENLYSKAIFLLDGNPFTCDCFAYKFVVALGRPEVAKRFRVEGARCAAPPALAGTPLKAAPPAALACALPAPACPLDCVCAVRPATALLELDCTAPPRAAPPPAPYGAAGVRLRLRSSAPDLAALPPEVRLLDLSGLGLTAAPAPPPRVTDLTIDLSDNNLTVAPLALLEAGCRVRLAGNELACDCEHRDSIAGLERLWDRVVDGPGVRCRGGGRVEGSPAARLCAMRDALVLGGSLAALGLLLAALAALAFRYSTEIRLVLRRYAWLDFLFDDKRSLGPEKTFDAFVSFSHRDDDFVRNELVPRLEGGRRPLKLCLHYRDWVIGGIIPQQIDWSVRESRRTIVVLSRAFLESGWGRVEFRAAHGLERVIVVLRGDVLKAEGMDAELRAYLTTNTYVHADDPLVWDRVREAVRSSRSALAPAAPAAPADKLSRGPLDVQLCDGRLVNAKY